MSVFQHLPNELLLLLASNLSHRDVVSLQRTTHQLFELLSPVVWRSVVFRGSSTSRFKKYETEMPFDRIGYEGYLYSQPKRILDGHGIDLSYVELGSRSLRSAISCGRRIEDNDHVCREETCHHSLLQHPVSSSTRPQLGLIQHAVFLHTFFQDSTDGTGEPGNGMVRLLREMRSLKKIVILIGKQTAWNMNRWDHLYGEHGRALSLVQSHPELRYDLWMQPFLDVFRNSEAVSFEIYTCSHSITDITSGGIDIRPETAFHAIHKLAGHVRIEALGFLLYQHRTIGDMGRKDEHEHFPMDMTKFMAEDDRRLEIPSLLASYSKSLRILDIGLHKLDLDLGIILSGTYPLEILKLRYASVVCSEHTDFSRLEHLEFHYCSFDSKIYETLFRPASYPKLRTLCFKSTAHTDIAQFSDDGSWPWPSALFPVLEVLKLDDVWNSPSSSEAWETMPVRCIVANAPKLGTLCFPHLTSAIVEAFHAAGPCRSLQKLKVPDIKVSGRDPRFLSLFSPDSTSVFPTLQTLVVTLNNYNNPFKLSWTLLDAVLYDTSQYDRRIVVKLEAMPMGSLYISQPGQERELREELDDLWEGEGREIMLLWLRAQSTCPFDPWTVESAEAFVKHDQAIMAEVEARCTDGEPQYTFWEYLKIANAILSAEDK